MSIAAKFKTVVAAATKTIRSNFTTGMVALDPNHLFGARRVYAAPTSVADTMQRLIGENQSVLREINRILQSHVNAVVMAAVVDGEFRVTAYGVVYNTIPTHYVGMDGLKSGVATFLVTKDPESKGSLRIQHVLFPQLNMHFDPYEVEFCYSNALEGIEPNLLHTVQFTINHC